MKLHLSGVKLPKLGSIQDRIFRDYLMKEKEVEVRRMEMLMLLALSNPEIQDPSKQRQWASTVKDVWSNFLSALFNIEIPKTTKKEDDMLGYYQNVMKKSKLKLNRDRRGKLHLQGIEQLGIR